MLFENVLRRLLGQIPSSCSPRCSLHWPRPQCRIFRATVMDEGRTREKYGLVSTAEVIVRVRKIIRMLICIKRNNYQFMNINSRRTRS